MSDTPDRPGSLFRQEALDEFAGRMRGDVLRLPSIKTRWLVLSLGLWLGLLLLLTFMPWREEFVLQATSATASLGEPVVEFVVPMHMAQDVAERHTVLLADGRATSMEFMGWHETHSGALRNILKRISTRHNLVVVVFKVPDSEVIRRDAATYQLKVSSTSLFDVVLLNVAGAFAEKNK